MIAEFFKSYPKWRYNQYFHTLPFRKKFLYIWLIGMPIVYCGFIVEFKNFFLIKNLIYNMLTASIVSYHHRISEIKQVMDCVLAGPVENYM